MNREETVAYWRKHSVAFGKFRVLAFYDSPFVTIGVDGIFFQVDYDDVLERSTRPQIIDFCQHHYDRHLLTKQVANETKNRLLKDGAL